MVIVSTFQHLTSVIIAFGSWIMFRSVGLHIRILELVRYVPFKSHYMVWGCVLVAVHVRCWFLKWPIRGFWSWLLCADEVPRSPIQLPNPYVKCDSSCYSQAKLSSIRLGLVAVTQIELQESRRSLSSVPHTKSFMKTSSVCVWDLPDVIEGLFLTETAQRRPLLHEFRANIHRVGILWLKRRNYGSRLPREISLSNQWPQHVCIFNCFDCT